MLSSPAATATPAVGRYAPPSPGAPVAAPTACAECEAALTGPYCAQCGQRAPGPDDLTLARFARAAAHEVSGTDARLVASLWALVRRPGLLTREFLGGHRRRWVSPVQLFLIASAAYFLVGMPVWLRATTMRADVVAQITRGVRTTAAGDAALLRRVTPEVVGSDAVLDRAGELMAWGKFGNLLALTLAAWALTRRRGHGGRGGLPALTFALHYYAFDFVFFTVAGLPLLAVAQLRGAPVSSASATPMMLVGAAYLYLAARRVWDAPRWRAALIAAALLLVDMLVSSTTNMVAYGAAAGKALAGG